MEWNLNKIHPQVLCRTILVGCVCIVSINLLLTCIVSVGDKIIALGI